MLNHWHVRYASDVNSFTNGSLGGSWVSWARCKRRWRVAAAKYKRPRRSRKQARWHRCRWDIVAVYKLREAPIHWLNYRSCTGRAGLRSCVARTQRTQKTSPRVLNGENRREWSSADHRNNQIGNYCGTSRSVSSRSSLLAWFFFFLFSFVCRPSFVSPLESLRKIAGYEMNAIFAQATREQPLLSISLAVKRRWLRTVICSSVYLNQSRLNMCPWCALCRFAHVSILPCMYLYARYSGLQVTINSVFRARLPLHVITN